MQASGMEALAGAKMVHRDLQTRNVLVFSYHSKAASKTSVKISEIGLAATHAYRRDDEAPPIRSLAPEVLEKERYSEHSDVWAFGVLVRTKIPTGIPLARGP